MKWFKNLLRIFCKDGDIKKQNSYTKIGLSDMFKYIGCPKCGAKHKYGINREYLTCYRCSHVFSPMKGRKYVEYMHSGYQNRAELNMLTREEKSLL